MSGVQHESDSIGKRRNYYRGNDYRRRKVENCLEPGLRGFICTCNYNGDQCKREAYNILNEYSESAETEKTSMPEKSKEEEDIEETLYKEVSALKEEVLHGSNRMKFQNVKTGAKNCLFIKSTIPDPVRLAVRILEDIEATRKQKSRFLLRMLPIEVTCKANMSNMETAFKPLAKKHFSSGGTTFAVIYRARFNNSLSRDEVIDLFAGLIKTTHPLNRADLSHPQLSVLVEIIKGICCIGVVPRFNELRRYNLLELASPAFKQNEGGGVEGMETRDSENVETCGETAGEGTVDEQKERLEGGTELNDENKVEMDDVKDGASQANKTEDASTVDGDGDKEEK